MREVFLWLIRRKLTSNCNNGVTKTRYYSFFALTASSISVLHLHAHLGNTLKIGTLGSNRPVRNVVLEYQQPESFYTLSFTLEHLHRQLCDFTRWPGETTAFYIMRGAFISNFI